jgi:hypothetical protein
MSPTPICPTTLLMVLGHQRKLSSVPSTRSSEKMPLLVFEDRLPMSRQPRICKTPRIHCIYDHVRSPLFVQEFELTSHQVSFKGILLSSLGAAFRVEFSTERAGKQIRWAQSKRLVAGTIVALTPQRDMFRSICKIAVVAARPILGGLDQNPPSIDLFWSDPNDAVIDPVGHYVMVESRTGYYEASRHMLVAMQKLMTEKYVFSHSMNPWLSEIHLDIDYQC